MMSTLTNTLLLLEFTAFFLFAITFLLQKRMRHPVERIRLIQGAFFTITATLFLVCLPNVPRMKLAVFPKHETIAEQQTIQENLTFPPQRVFITDTENTVSQTEPVLASTPQIVPISQKTVPAPVLSEKQLAFSLKDARYFFDFTVLSVFGIGAVYFTFFWLVGAVRLRKILRTATPLKNELMPPNILLFASREITTPLVCYSLRYFMRPVILVPSHFSGQSLRFALLHEMSHVSRGDLWSWHLLTLFAPLFWIQPFYVPLCRQLQLDQDFLADQNALQNTQEKTRQNTNEPEDYAALLLSLARLQKQNILPTALSMGDRPTLLHRRIEMILHCERNPLRTRPRRHIFYGMFVMFGLLTLLLGTVRLTTAQMTPAAAPKTTLQSSPQTTDAAPSKDTAANKNETSEKLVEIIFTALDPEGKPVPGATVGFRYSDWNYPIEKTWTTDADGCVKTKVPFLAIDTESSWFTAYHRERELIAQVDFTPKKTGIAEPIKIQGTLEKARRITGNVVDSEGKPVENAFVSGSGFGVLRIACTQTDKEGRFELDTLSSRTLAGVFAFKPKIGYASVAPDGDMWNYNQRLDNKNWKNEKHNNGPFTFKLEKRNEPITVKVISDYGQPLQGIMVTLGSGVHYDRHPLEPNGLESLLGIKTDAQGNAVFDWLPPFGGQMSFIASGSNPRFDKTTDTRLYGWKTQEWYEGASHFVITLPKRVEIRGSVRREDGSPVPWCQLCYHTGTLMSVGETTDHAGNFSFDINEGSNLTILPAQNSRSLVAPKQWIERVGRAWESDKLPRFDFVLKEGTKVYGKVVSSVDQKPMPGEYFWVAELKGSGELATRNFFSERHIRADANGDYTVYFPPGSYRVWRKDDTIAKTFEIKDEKEIHIDLESTPTEVLQTSARN